MASNCLKCNLTQNRNDDPPTCSCINGYYQEGT